jgi:hypothetical protein
MKRLHIFCAPGSHTNGTRVTTFQNRHIRK